jgi:hypothetical protein
MIGRRVSPLGRFSFDVQHFNQHLRNGGGGLASSSSRYDACHNGTGSNATAAMIAPATRRGGTMPCTRIGSRPPAARVDVVRLRLVGISLLVSVRPAPL